MRGLRHIAVGIVAVGLCLAPASAAGSAPAGWRVADLRGAPLWVYAVAINERGQVVGHGALGARRPADEYAGEYEHALLWQKGKVRDLGRIGAPGSSALVTKETQAVAINDHGQVVGWSDTRSALRDHRPHAFLWQKGRMRDLGTLGGKRSYAVGINNAGEVVGWSDTRGGAGHAFVWKDGQMADLGTLGGKESRAVAVNASGEVVGWSETKGGARHAFVWHDGLMVDLDTLPGRSQSEAVAINDRGEIVGASFAWGRADNRYALDPHAFLWQDGSMIGLGRVAIRDYGPPGGYEIAINDRGQVAGTSRMSGGQRASQRAFLWANGRRSYLPIPSSGKSSGASAINEHGQVVGWVQGHFSVNDLQHAFLWDDDKMIDLGVLGGGNEDSASAWAINERVEIIGESAGWMGPPHAVLWTQRPSSS